MNFDDYTTGVLVGMFMMWWGAPRFKKIFINSTPTDSTGPR